MKRKERELLLNYIINNRCYLRQDLDKLTQAVRYRQVDSVDCLELIIAQERYNSFVEYSKQILILLKLDEENENND